ALAGPAARFYPILAFVPPLVPMMISRIAPPVSVLLVPRPFCVRLAWLLFPLRRVQCAACEVQIAGVRGRTFSFPLPRGECFPSMRGNTAPAEDCLDTHRITRRIQCNRSGCRIAVCRDLPRANTS